MKPPEWKTYSESDSGIYLVIDVASDLNRILPLVRQVELRLFNRSVHQIGHMVRRVFRSLASFLVEHLIAAPLALLYQVGNVNVLVRVGL